VGPEDISSCFNDDIVDLIDLGLDEVNLIFDPVQGFLDSDKTVRKVSDVRQTQEFRFARPDSSIPLISVRTPASSSFWHQQTLQRAPPSLLRIILHCDLFCHTTRVTKEGGEKRQKGTASNSVTQQVEWEMGTKHGTVVAVELLKV